MPPLSLNISADIKYCKLFERKRYESSGILKHSTEAARSRFESRTGFSPRSSMDKGVDLYKFSSLSSLYTAKQFSVAGFLTSV
jgi:hypothetical protein